MNVFIFLTYTIVVEFIFNNSNSIDNSNILIDICLHEEDSRSYYDRSGSSYIISKDSSSDSKCELVKENDSLKKMNH